MIKKEKKTVLAWHFLTRNKRLAYGDDREIVPGGELSVRGRLCPCVNGLHASKNILHALEYAALLSERGNQCWIICRVRLTGNILTGHDKLCARKRKVLWMIDGKEVLKNYAKKRGAYNCSCGRSVLDRAANLKNPNEHLLLELIYEEAKKQGLIK